ncbi:MAG: DUF2723 domain-containing protein [Bacteroidales bacterium]|jgi:hypothetical protein|nr:DUF2723 domain-containing protein [Bacteroidales bacterium]
MKYQKTINILGWLVGITAFVVYFLTMNTSVSFWDCGEFLSTGYKLQVGHPPGAPLYQLFAAIASALCMQQSQLIAPFITCLSAISTATTIMFFFWILVRILNRFSDKYVGNIIAATIGALTFAFTDSLWTSATEAEVYSFSLMFSTLIFWSILKWDTHPSERWIILIAFLTGLSLGIHILSLLIIPPVLLIICYHYYKPSFFNTTVTLLISVLLIWLLFSIIPFVITTKPLYIYIILSLLIILFVFSIWKKVAWLNTFCLSIFFIIIGISTYLVLLIRAEADTPINEYNPKTLAKLNYYLQRDNYEKPPLFYGNQYTAYSFAEYRLLDNGNIETIFNNNMQSLFPRLWHPSYESAYIDWIGKPDKQVTIKGQNILTPSFKQNIKFFFNYQLGYMYGRYLMWNFVGKTNDIQGFGDVNNGQWQSGFHRIDRILGINTQAFPKNTLKRGSTAYYFIPLMFVIIGIFYHFFKDRKGFIVNFWLWFFTSIAIVIYLNFTPFQARERDYIFLISFLALSIWLCVGTLAVSQWIVNLMLLHRPRFILPIFFIVPAWVLSQNFISHNHNRQYTTKNFAYSILESCDKDAILLTNGDNDTFPLWYLQNVENIRTDVRVINIAFLNSPDYIEQLKKQIYNSKPLKILTPQKYYNDTTTVNYLEVARNLFSTTNKHNQIFRTLKENVVLQGNVYSLGTLMLMDIILANQTERSIYFSAYSNDDFLTLDNFLHLEGFAYRLDSIKSNMNQLLPPKYGDVDASKMYQHFKNFQWQGFKRKNTYFNELERSIIDLYAQYTSFLSFALYQQKEYEKAFEVLEICTQNLPVSVHKYPHPLAYMAVMYDLLEGKVRADDNHEKANHFIFYTLEYYKGYMQHYFSLSDDFKAQERWEAQKIMTNWLYLCSFTDDNKLDDLRLNLVETFFNTARDFLEISYKHLETMFINSDFYNEEIDKTISLIKDIFTISKRYEEPMPEPSKKIKQLF